MFDTSISLGNLLTIVTFLGGSFFFAGVVRSRVDALAIRLLTLEKSMEKIVEVLVIQGRQEERMNSIDGRLLAQGQRIDDLSRQVNRLFNPRES